MLLSYSLSKRQQKKFKDSLWEEALTSHCVFMCVCVCVCCVCLCADMHLSLRFCQTKCESNECRLKQPRRAPDELSRTKLFTKCFRCLLRVSGFHFVTEKCSLFHRVGFFIFFLEVTQTIFTVTAEFSHNPKQ